MTIAFIPSMAPVEENAQQLPANININDLVTQFADVIKDVKLACGLVFYSLKLGTANSIFNWLHRFLGLKSFKYLCFKMYIRYNLPGAGLYEKGTALESNTSTAMPMVL